VRLADSLMGLLDSVAIYTRHAEGSPWFQVSDSTLLRWMGAYLTPATYRFVTLSALEQREPVGADASLQITWDQLGDRLARVDSLVSTAPTAPFVDRAQTLYLHLLRWYVRGADNTPAFDRRTRQLTPALRVSYERYLSRHGGTRAGDLIRGYLDVLRASGFVENAAVVEYLRTHSGLPEHSLPSVRGE
jgi:hypothetical protein